MPPGGQGWATNVAAPAQGSSDEDRVMKLEQTAFGSTYPEHEVEDRVDHLEKEVLGGKSEGSMSDRISKLEAKLGGAGAFGHTNTPPPGGRGSRSSSTGSEPNLADFAPQTASGAEPTIAGSTPPAAGAGSSQVPFPAAQAESEQPLAAVAQALGGPGRAPDDRPGDPRFVSSKAPSAPIPLPKHVGAPAPAHAKPKNAEAAPASAKHVEAPVKKTTELPASGKSLAVTGKSMPSPGAEVSASALESPPNGMEVPVSAAESPEMGMGTPSNGMGVPSNGMANGMGMPSNGTETSANNAEPPAKSAHSQAKGAHAPDKSKLHPAKSGAPKSAGAVNPPEVQAVIDTIPSDPKAGDYFAAVKKFEGNTVARWTSFPITIKLPPESPDSWKKNLQVGINEWNRYIPLQSVADSADGCDVEVTWVNKLLPGVLGITRLTTPKKGNIHVEIWMLRPTFYQQEIPEHALQVAFLHELGHAVGIFGHSSGQDDLMASVELSLAMKGKAAVRSLSVEPKDLNTLKEIYDSPAIPSSFMLSQPLEWSGHQPQHSNR
jgi:predicted Zn-dependent protease